MNSTDHILTTTKEKLYLHRFTKADVIDNVKDRIIRTSELELAMRAGNLFKSKVCIYFKDSLNRLLRINTTIWGITPQFVILKRGVTIPITSIVRVE